MAELAQGNKAGHDSEVVVGNDGCAMPFANEALIDRPLRVMRVLTRANLGGPTRQAISLWHAHKEMGVETLLVTGAVDSSEVELSPQDHGVLAAPADGSNPGWLQLDHMRRGLNPLADWRARIRLRELMRKFRPDVVHTHTSKAGWVGRKTAWSERVSVVAHTFHGHVLKDYFGRLPSRFLAYLERQLARRSDLLFAVSPSCAEELAGCHVAPMERLAVVPPAVDMKVALPRQAAREQLGVNEQEWRVCAVGRLVPIKRLSHFVEMVAAQPDLHGDIIGDGPDRSALLAQAQGKADGRVDLRGANVDVAVILPAYDAVVLPSKREGCPLVAVEAFAAGVPVVGYDVPGVRDALSHFGRGILVPEADGPLGLLQAVTCLREDSKARKRLVADSERGVKLFHPSMVAATLLSAYREVLAQKRKLE